MLSSALIIFPFYLTSVHGVEIMPCCPEKTVGGVDYILVDLDTGLTNSYGCSQDCVYEKCDAKISCYSI